MQNEIYEIIKSVAKDTIENAKQKEVQEAVPKVPNGTDAPEEDEFYQKMASAFTVINNEQKEIALKLYLSKTANQTNLSETRMLLQTLSNLVDNGVITARMLCDQLLSCEKLVYQNHNFWIESFHLLKKTIVPRKNSTGVDYKGVREIMKGCRDKAHSFPYILNSSNLPQMLALESVIEFIFDRNACLLPAYFIANEIQKVDAPEPHWKMANLMAHFVEDFRKTAQMLTLIGHSEMLPIVEHFGYADHMINPWRLDPHTLKFSLKGNLPYDSEVTQPQIKLLRFVLEQPYSKEMICSILNLQKQHKQRCIALEEQLVWLIISTMERSEQEPQNQDNNDESNAIHWLWLHLSSQLIYFVLFQFGHFPNIVMALQEKLTVRTDLRKGRDQLMWVLLQFISGSIQRNPLTNFLPVLKLYDILYPEKEPLPIPDFNKTHCTRQMAPTCIWIHLLKKAQTDQTNIYRPIPTALKNHHIFLQELVMPNNVSLSMGNDFRIALLCNAYSTNQDYFSRPMAALVDTILGNQKNIQSSGMGANASNSSSNLPTVPLSMVMLDSLTVHSKMSLIHSIVTHMIKQAQTKSNIAPVLVETYSRLLVYTEIESLGIKSFLTQLLPTLFKSNAWGILYTLLEMFSYRMHHIQSHYRVQLLTHLHSLASVPHTNQMQLHLCVESTALRLITGLGSADVQPQISRYLVEPKTGTSVVSAESEELNRALILTLARSMHITGTGNDSASSSWCKDLLSGIMQYTPHSWTPHTLQCFPTALNEFFTQNSTAKENKQLLKKSVEEEYRNWVSMSNENDIISHFSVNVNPPLFLCLIFKMIFETDGISPVAYKILERIGARGLSAHLRKLIDYLVFEVASSAASGHVNKCVDTINDMIWKYNVVTIDRLVLCLALRTQEGNVAQVCFFIIQLILLKSHEFRNRTQEFVKENSPVHWKQNNWHEKHLAFHQKYPEKFSPDESHPTLPVYFGNVCLRFLPVLDIVIHRFLEIPIPSVMKTMEAILEHLGCLYKFHDRPITYLYNTLHYYERKLRDCPLLKKKLVAAVIGSLKEVRPANWALTEQFQLYLQKPEPAEATTPSWQPELPYYIALVKRLIETIDQTNVFYITDWRFNEFPNPAAHALYITCVEILALPQRPQVVANSIFDVVVKGYPAIPNKKLHRWINAIGLIMANLPEAYWSVMYDRLQEVLTSAQMLDWNYRYSPFEMFNFKTVVSAMMNRTYVSTLAISQSILHHFGIGQITMLPEFVKEKLKPIIRTEHQLIYLCHVVGPFLQRLNSECPRQVPEITAILYELIQTIDESYGSKPLLFMDPICDLLYHIKYMFVGDTMKVELETIIRKLRPAFQKRLRFITRMNVDEIITEAPADGNVNTSTPQNVQTAPSQQTTPVANTLPVAGQGQTNLLKPQ